MGGDGAIISVNSTPAAAGVGYAEGDTGVLTNGSGTAAYVVDSVGSMGPINTATANGDGTGYAVGDLVGVGNPGSGDAFGVVSSIGGSGELTGVVFPSYGSPTLAAPPAGSGGTSYGLSSGNGVAAWTASPGAVTQSAVHTPGTAYAINDTGKVSGGGDGNAYYVVTGVNGTGGVTAYVIYRNGNDVNLGAGYLVASNVGTTVSTGLGDGAFTVDIASVSSLELGMNGTLNITSLDAGVSTFHLTSNGTGYSIESNSPTATGGAQPGTGTGFQVGITSVNSGVVTGYTITNPGTMNTVATGVGTSATSGAGSGLTINVDSVTVLGDGTAEYTLFYTVVPVTVPTLS